MRWCHITLNTLLLHYVALLMFIADWRVVVECANAQHCRACWAIINGLHLRVKKRRWLECQLYQAATWPYPPPVSCVYCSHRKEKNYIRSFKGKSKEDQTMITAVTVKRSLSCLMIYLFNVTTLWISKHCLLVNHTFLCGFSTSLSKIWYWFLAAIWQLCLLDTLTVT